MMSIFLYGRITKLWAWDTYLPVLLGLCWFRFPICYFQDHPIAHGPHAWAMRWQSASFVVHSQQLTKWSTRRMPRASAFEARSNLSLNAKGFRARYMSIYKHVYRYIHIGFVYNCICFPTFGQQNEQPCCFPIRINHYILATLQPNGWSSFRPSIGDSLLQGTFVLFPLRFRAVKIVLLPKGAGDHIVQRAVVQANRRLQGIVAAGSFLGRRNVYGATTKATLKYVCDIYRYIIIYIYIYIYLYSLRLWILWDWMGFSYPTKERIWHDSTNQNMGFLQCWT